MTSHHDGPDIRILKHSGEEFSFHSEHMFFKAVSEGKVHLEDQVFYPDWTNGVWVSVSDLASMMSKEWSLDTLVSLRLREKRPPVLSSLICLLLPLTYLLSLGLSEAEAHYFVLGWSHVLLDDHWWAPWTSQLLHGSKGHLLSNMVLLFFLGTQVERALGIWGMLAVLQLGLLFGSVLILFLGSDPVIGSSIWLFALWGAVFMIGWRFEQCITQVNRFLYGWWSFLLFVPVYVLQLHLDALSHLGHLGGLLGGVAAVAVLRQGLMVVSSSCLVLLSLPFLDVAIPHQVIEHDVLQLRIPSRFQNSTAAQNIMWKSYTFDPAQLLLQIRKHQLEPAFYQNREIQEPLKRTWLRGIYDIQLSCELPESSSGRMENCVQWIAEARLLEPLSLRQLRHKIEQGASARLHLKLAQGLLEFGSLEEADELLSELWLRDDAIGFEARKDRLFARMLAPDLGVYREDRSWVISIANTTPSTEPLKLWAASYLLAHEEQDACEILQLNCRSSEELGLLLEGGVQ